MYPVRLVPVVAVPCGVKVYSAARNPKDKYHYAVVVEGGRRKFAKMPPPRSFAVTTTS